MGKNRMLNFSGNDIYSKLIINEKGRKYKKTNHISSYDYN
jgi:hypothetical protein